MPLSLRIGATIVAVAAFGGACSHDTTAPAPSLAVSLALDGPPSETFAASTDTVKLTCSVVLTATARGSGSATWQDGVLRFYLGPSRTVAVDSQSIAAADIEQVWGTQITAGNLPRGTLSFNATIPFEVEIEFHYIGQNGTVGAPAKVRFACGPLPTAGAAAPTITQLSVAGLAGDVEPGAPIDVTYTASSPSALWSTTVAISGAFTVQQGIAERGASAANRTVHFVVPRGSQIGVPITITVVATDAGLQRVSQSVQTGRSVVDSTPPSIRIAMLTNGIYGRLAGQFAVGDMLQLFVDASDNNTLDWLVWEIGAGTQAIARDSLRAPPRVAANVWSPSIPVRPEWVGASAFSVYVRDVAGLKSTVRLSPPDSFRVYPLVTRAATAPVTATSTQSPYPTMGDLAYDAKRNVFYLALNTSEIAVLDVATMTFKTPIVLTAPAAALDLSPSGDSLIAAVPSSRSLAVVDLARPTAAPATIALTVLDTAGSLYSVTTPLPSLVRVAANGKAIVSLSNRTRSGDAIVDVDLRTGAQTIRTDARSTNPYAITTGGATPDRSRIVLLDYQCPRSYLSATDAFSACGPFPSTYNPRGMTFDAAGQRFAIANGAFNVDLTPLRVADPINGQVPMSAISSDGASLYLGANQTVSRMNIADGVLTERFTIPLTAHRLFVSPAGDWLVVFQNDYGVRATRVTLR